MLSEAETATSYDRSIRGWLSFLKECFYSDEFSDECNYCILHSYPQTSYFLNPKAYAKKQNYKLPNNVGVVGDLKELKGLLEISGIKFWKKLSERRNSTTDEIKVTQYPRKFHW